MDTPHKSTTTLCLPADLSAFDITIVLMPGGAASWAMLPAFVRAQLPKPDGFVDTIVSAALTPGPSTGR